MNMLNTRAQELLHLNAVQPSLISLCHLCFTKTSAVKRFNNQNHKCKPDGGTIGNLMGNIRVSRINPLGSTNVCVKLYGHPSYSQLLRYFSLDQQLCSIMSQLFPLLFTGRPLLYRCNENTAQCVFLLLHAQLH